MERMIKSLEAMGDYKVRRLSDHEIEYDGCRWTFDRSGQYLIDFHDPHAAFRRSAKR